MDDDFNKAYSAELTEEEKKEIEIQASRATGNLSLEDRLKLREHMFRTKKAMGSMDKEKFASTVSKLTDAMNTYYCNDAKMLLNAFETFRLMAVRYHMSPDGIKLIDVIGNTFIYPMEIALSEKHDKKKEIITKEINDAFLVGCDDTGENESEDDDRLRTNAEWIVEVST